jgi:glycosyltransferase 2 family protein
MSRVGLAGGRIVMGIAITIVCLLLALRNVPVDELRDTLERVNYWWLLPAVAAQLASLGAKARRWRVLLLERAGMAEVFWAQAIGLLGTNLFPLRAGEAARVLTISRRASIPLAGVAASVLVEAVLDIAIVLALLASLLMFAALPPAVTTAGLALGVALVPVLAVGLLLVARADRALTMLSIVLRPLPAPVRASLYALARDASIGLRGLRGRGAVGRVLGWSALMWASAVAAAWAVIEAVAPGASPLEPLFAVAAISLGIAIPSSPGGMGVFEFVGQQALLLPFPERYTASSALVVALLAHSLYYALTSALGAVGLARLGLSLANVRAVARWSAPPRCPVQGHSFRP